MSDTLRYRLYESKTTLLAAGGLVILLLLVLGWLTFFKDNNDTVVDADPAAAPITSEGCPQAETQNDEIPTQQPEVNWEKHDHGIVVPISEEHGPFDIDENKIATCYTHTPTGALIAMMNIDRSGLAMTTKQDAMELYPKALEKVAFKNEGFLTAKENAVEFFENDSESYDQALDRQKIRTCPIVGYEFISYDDEVAEILHVVDCKDKGFIGLNIGMYWEDKTWKVVLSDWGDFDNDDVRDALPDLAGVTKWDNND